MRSGAAATAAGLAAAASRSADASSPAVANRSAGSFASPRRIAWSREPAAGTIDEGSGGRFPTCAWISSATSPKKGGRPVTSSNAMTASE